MVERRGSSVRSAPSPEATGRFISSIQYNYYASRLRSAQQFYANVAHVELRLLSASGLGAGWRDPGAFCAEQCGAIALLTTTWLSQINLSTAPGDIYFSCDGQNYGTRPKIGKIYAVKSASSAAHLNRGEIAAQFVTVEAPVNHRRKTQMYIFCNGTTKQQAVKRCDHRVRRRGGSG